MHNTCNFCRWTKWKLQLLGSNLFIAPNVWLQLTPQTRGVECGNKHQSVPFTNLQNQPLSNVILRPTGTATVERSFSAMNRIILLASAAACCHGIRRCQLIHLPIGGPAIPDVRDSAYEDILLAGKRNANPLNILAQCNTIQSVAPSATIWPEFEKGSNRNIVPTFRFDINTH